MTFSERLFDAAAGGGGVTVFHATATPRPLGAAELLDMALVRAGRLADLGVGPADRVGVIGPNMPEWCAWAHATWLLGATLVGLPVPLRMRDRHALATQVRALTEAFECRIVASHERLLPVVDASLALCWDDVDPDRALDRDRVVKGNDDDLAAIIPTSGSTSAPKGVGYEYRETHESNLAQYYNRAGRPILRYLTYSPMAHGGGTVAFSAPLDPTFEVHVLPPERFARDPGELFRLIGRHRIHATMAATSAVAAALRAVERRSEQVDLSSLDSLTLTYEMVDPDVLDRIVEVGARFGLRPEAVCTSYGTSEGGHTGTTFGERIRIDEIDLDVLATQGVARPPATAGTATKRVTSSGAPSGTMELRIVDTAGSLPERHVGEVQFRGPRMMRGYIGAGAEEAFTSDGWLHTGDVGYVAEGQLFLTGRIKEVVVQQGKKYHPEDIEWAAARAADISPSECVAFTLEGSDDGAIIAIETSVTDGLQALEQRVRAAVVNNVGVTLRTVVFVEPATLPKASSGKPQRLAARDQYARGELATNRSVP